MEEVEYLKCPCKECGNNIEFPASAARRTVVCPHCGEWTELIAPEDEEEEEDEPSIHVGLVPLIGCVALLLVLAGGGIWFWKHKSPAPVQTSAMPNPPLKIAVAKYPVSPAPQKAAPSPEPATESNEVVAQAAPKAPSRSKSPDDLKVGAIELEKTKGSSLVYAVGTLNNDSDYDRYGIRVEVDLFNAKGAKIGTAKDYKDYLAPHQDWQFRALIPEPKAVVKAQLASIKEDQ